MDDPQPTERLYLNDTYLFTGNAAVVTVDDKGSTDEEVTVILSRTVFHPQGGGQPTDRGFIRGSAGVFAVEMVKDNGGIVVHMGRFTEGGPFKPADEVTMEVDEKRRRLNARLHSAGHMVDAAVTRAGYTSLKPAKGYHFADGPYVEYTGVVPAAERDAFVCAVNDRLRELVAEAIETQVTMVSKDEAGKLLGGDGSVEHLPDDQDVRIVEVAGGLCPCGGTHVRSTAEIGRMEVTKLKCKKESVRVSYKLLDS